MSTRVAQIRNDELNVLWRTANGIAKGRLFKDVATPEDAFARILVGRDLGLTPTDSVKNIVFSDGAPIVSAEVQASLLRNFVGPDGERYDFDVVTPETKREDECHILIKRREAGAKGWKKRGTEVFTIADAERAELTGNDYWRKWPRRMLFARALTNAIGTYAPETVHPQLAFELPENVPADAGVGALAEDDPLRAGDLVPEEARAEEDRSLSRAAWTHLRDVHEYLEHRGEGQRFVDALNVVGAPECDDPIKRIAGLTENQGVEVLQRLDIPVRNVSAFKRDRARREARERDERRAEREAAIA